MQSTILVTGVSPKWLETASSKGYETGSPNKSEEIRASIEKMMADFKSLTNTSHEFHTFDPDDAEDFEKFVVVLKSRKWDGISYGGGIRTIPQLSSYFTRVINRTIKEHPTTTLVFPLLPELVVPAFKEHLHIS